MQICHKCKKEKIYCKNLCQGCYNFDYYLKHKEKLDRTASEWSKNNKERVSKNHKEHYKRNREKIIDYVRRYSRENQDKIKEKSRKYREEHREYNKKWQSEYKQKNKEIRNHKEKIKRDGDKNYQISILLRNKLGKTLRYYTRTGKIMSSRKYGIDYKAIIEHLKPFPEDLSKYHIDHIRPLCSFQFVNEDGSTNLEEVKKAFAPENHQWLTAEENLKKSGKFL